LTVAWLAESHGSIAGTVSYCILSQGKDQNSSLSMAVTECALLLHHFKAKKKKNPKKQKTSNGNIVSVCGLIKKRSMIARLLALEFAL
jgi:hypothetical protein